MAFDLKQTLKLGQQLVMTPQLQQAIRLLQLNRIELAELLREELLENPVLEEELEDEKLEDEEKDKEEEPKKEEMKELKGEGEGKEDFDWENYVQNYTSTNESFIHNVNPDLPSYESTIQNKMTLSTHLLWQLRMTAGSDEERSIGVTLIGNIDDNGYLKSSLEDIAEKNGHSYDEIEKVLKKIQAFDPIGVGARDLKECLLLQSKNLPNQELIEQIIMNHLHDLEIKNYKLFFISYPFSSCISWFILAILLYPIKLKSWQIRARARARVRARYLILTRYLSHLSEHGNYTYQ